MFFFFFFLDQAGNATVSCPWMRLTLVLPFVQLVQAGASGERGEACGRRPRQSLPPGA